MIKKTLLLICSALLSNATFANNGNVQSVIDAFTNCDNSFFYQLKTNASDLNGITDLIIQDDIAYIPVKDGTADRDSTNYFITPIEYRGLMLTGYQNIYVQTSPLTQHYYWGFIIDDSIENVKESLKQLPWQQYNIASYAANPKLYDNLVPNRGWQNNPYIIDGVLPRENTVEKSLYLVPINDKQVRLVCSIQGDITQELLYLIHPDIKYINQVIDAERENQDTTVLELFDNEQSSDSIGLDEQQTDSDDK